MKKNLGFWIAILVLGTILVVVSPRVFNRTWSFWAPEVEAAVPSVPTKVPSVPAPVAATVDEVKMPYLDCGEFGSYQAISIGDNWEYWMQEPHKVSGQYGLVELKLRGGECKFSVPTGFIAIWNQSAGKVFINESKGNLGNPVKLNGSEMLTGSIVSQWEAKNDSAGIMITLIPE